MEWMDEYGKMGTLGKVNYHALHAQGHGDGMRGGLHLLRLNGKGRGSYPKSKIQEKSKLKEAE